jgi:hypothetical protein
VPVAASERDERRRWRSGQRRKERGTGAREGERRRMEERGQGESRGGLILSSHLLRRRGGPWAAERAPSAGKATARRGAGRRTGNGPVGPTRPNTRR